MLRIPKILSILFAGVTLTLSAQLKTTDSPAVKTDKKQVAQFNYFQQSGNSLDALVCRIQFKISYEWMKAREYFTLALSSPVDALPAKGRDLEARVNLKTEALGQKAADLQKQAIAAGKNKIAETAANLAGQSDKLKAQAIQAGNEWKKEAETELSKKLGK